MCIYVHMFLSFKCVPLYVAVFFWSNDWLIHAYVAKWEHNADFKAPHDKKRKKTTEPGDPPHATNIVNKMPINLLHIEWLLVE